ncbi:histidine phosphatase family protein [Caulobacter segnis]|uniref:histidine phosphatase family protein n=1 Tax=Caulobacter segnis TaxID=88688 RepID=UPI00240FE10F|nr:histidine phosphatase family protein [Caulobacter segnis]MDG2522188.1 histidine phosphatase family protein [Caulobacter segnis]
MTVEVLFVTHASCGLGSAMPGGRVHDLDLSADGLRHADRLGEMLAQRKLAAVYCSPLRPARLTAGPIAKAAKAPLRLDDDLQAIDFGVRTGEPMAPFLAGGDPGFDLVTGGGPQGEGLADVGRRALRFMAHAEAAHAGRSVAAVTHVELVRAAVCLVLGMGLAAHDRLAIEPGGVTEVLFGDWGARLAGLNQTPTP